MSRTDSTIYNQNIFFDVVFRFKKTTLRFYDTLIKEYCYLLRKNDKMTIETTEY